LIFSHAFDGPDLYGALSFFETMPSKPSLQMALNISLPSPSVLRLAGRDCDGGHSQPFPKIGKGICVKAVLRNCIPTSPAANREENNALGSS
jgi:hypothetical protein